LRRSRRLELTRAGLEESLVEDELDRFRVVVETLAEQFDVMDVAAAAVKLARDPGRRDWHPLRVGAQPEGARSKSKHCRRPPKQVPHGRLLAGAALDRAAYSSRKPSRRYQRARFRAGNSTFPGPGEAYTAVAQTIASP
jgi:hypothetical protein